MWFAKQRQLKITFLILCYFFNFILGGPDQRRLLKYLMNENQYDQLERPVKNESQTLPVSINLALQQIIDFDGKNEVIIISGWIVLMWNDYSLTWNPEEYGNIQTLRIPSTQIWIPDVLLYNSADEKFDSTMRVNAVVQHTGDILYVPPGIFKSICPFDIAAFPFVSFGNDLCLISYFRFFLDTQNCTLKFGSWTFDDTGINLTAESNKGQLDAYVKSAEWDLEDFSATSNALKYDCCPTLYPFVLYTIRIRRRSLYYFTNIVLPCFLISCMTILGFLLAPDSGEKLTLQITILLSVVMFSLLMAEIMPPSSNAIPIITIYFMCIMVMSSISVVASVIVISLHYCNAKNHTMPEWVCKYICYYLAWLLCMKRPRHDLTWAGIRRRWTLAREQSNSINGSIPHYHYKSPSVPLLDESFELLTNNVINIDRQSFQSIDEREQERSNSIMELPLTQMSKLRPGNPRQYLPRASHVCDIEMIRSELRIIISHLATLTHETRRQGQHDDVSQDWKFVAMVVDRLCLIIFTLSMALFTALTLFSAPNFFKLQ